MFRLLLLSFVVLAGCSSPPPNPDLVNKYLAEANVGLPRVNHPFTIEKVEKRGRDLVTIATIKPDKMSDADFKDWMAGNQGATSKSYDAEILRICRDPYYDALLPQGYVFKFKGTSITKSVCNSL